MSRDIIVRRLNSRNLDIPSAEMGTTVTCSLKGFFLTPIIPIRDTGDNEVSIDLSLRNVESESFEYLPNEKFKIGEGDGFPALELSLRHSRVGDHFLLRTAHRFAFGYDGREVTVPPKMDLQYEVKVLSHLREGEIDEEFVQSQMESISKISAGKFSILLPNDLHEDIQVNCKRWGAFADLSMRKEAGNRWFKYKDFLRAAKAYSKGTKIADEYFKSVDQYQSNQSNLVKMGPNGQMQINPNYEEEKDSEEKSFEEDGQELIDERNRDLVVFVAYVACLNNLAACYIELGELLKARDMCIKVLEIDPTNAKALLRASKASLALHVRKFVCVDGFS